MEDSSLFKKLVSHLRSFSRYHTGYPRDIGPSPVIQYESTNQLLQVLNEGYPVVVAFTIRCSYTQHLDKMLDASAAEFYPYVKFIRVECPKHPGYCISRERKDYPFIEIFQSPIPAQKQGSKTINTAPSTKYTLKFLPFNYDVSPYGFREYFKRHGIPTSETPMQEDAE